MCSKRARAAARLPYSVRACSARSSPSSCADRGACVPARWGPWRLARGTGPLATQRLGGVRGVLQVEGLQPLAEVAHGGPLDSHRRVLHRLPPAADQDQAVALDGLPGPLGAVPGGAGLRQQLDVLLLQGQPVTTSRQKARISSDK